MNFQERLNSGMYEKLGVVKKYRDFSMYDYLCAACSRRFGFRVEIIACPEFGEGPSLFEVEEFLKSHAECNDFEKAYAKALEEINSAYEEGTIDYLKTNNFIGWTNLKKQEERINALVLSGSPELMEAIRLYKDMWLIAIEEYVRFKLTTFKETEKVAA